MKLEPSDVEDAESYVRSDVSGAVVLALVVGVVFGFVNHWAFFTTTLAVCYMAIGLSTVYEWNKALVKTGCVPQGLFGTVRTAAFLPALVFLVSLHFSGHSPIVSGTVSFGLFVGYLYALYAFGFRNVDSESVHFESDPYTGEEKVWREDVYIPRLERWSVEQAGKNED